MAQQPLPKWEGLFSLHLLCDRRSERAFAATHPLRWLVPEVGVYELVVLSEA